MKSKSIKSVSGTIAQWLLAGALIVLSIENVNAISIPIEARQQFLAGTDFVLPRKSTKPKSFEWLTNLPHDYSSFGKKLVERKNQKNIALVVGSTALLLAYDQQLLNNVQDLSSTIHLSAADEQTKVLDWSAKVGKTSLALPLFIPHNLNTSFYFQGDGLTHLTIILGFWSYGKITGTNRSLQTASQLMESLIAGGIATQFLKHVTGRESPFVSTQKGGKWKFFPNQADYSKHVPHYDAFPSGHLATLVGAVTVISNNYPEYHFIKPIGYGMSALLALAMMNNGVHWAADYPLGIAIGYTFGNLISKREEARNQHDSKTSSLFNKVKPQFVLPYASGTASGVSLFWNF